MCNEWQQFRIVKSLSKSLGHIWMLLPPSRLQILTLDFSITIVPEAGLDFSVLTSDWHGGRVLYRCCYEINNLCVSTTAHSHPVFIHIHEYCTSQAFFSAGGNNPSPHTWYFDFVLLNEVYSMWCSE